MCVLLYVISGVHGRGVKFSGGVVCRIIPIHFSDESNIIYFYYSNHLDFYSV